MTTTPQTFPNTSSTSTTTTAHPSTPHFSAAQLSAELQKQEGVAEAARTTPTDEQTAVIQASPDPMLVVAGAGSGKTKTMADRVVWLVANGHARPDEILGVTYTRKAAAELRERVTLTLKQLVASGLVDLKQILDDDAAHQTDAGALGELLAPSVSTYHSYANALVTEYGLRIGLEPDTRLIGQAKAWQLIHQIAVEYKDSGVLAAEKQTAGKLARDVFSLANDCAEHLATPEDVMTHLDAELARYDTWVEELTAAGAKIPHAAQKLAGTLRVRREQAQLVQLYQDRKAAESLIDFGDQLRHAVHLAATVPAVGQSERAKYKVVILDEFQDTSYAQLKLFGSLYGQLSGEGIGHCVIAVGDPNQSIYGFRGASAGQLYDFPQFFPRVDRHARRTPADIRQLTIAFRNGQRILQVANKLVEPFRAPSSETPWHRHTAHLRKDLKGLRSLDGAPEGAVRYGFYTHEEEEATAIAQQIKAEFDAATRHQRPTPTCAVLSRRRAQFASIAEQLEALGIDYEIVGLSGLLKTPEVNEVLSYLRVIADPGRSDALIRILAGARYRIGPKDLVALHRSARGLERLRSRGGATAESEDRYGDAELETAERGSLVEALDVLNDDPGTAARAGLSKEGHRRLIAARDQFRRLRTWGTLDVGTLMQRVISDTGLDIEVAARPWADREHATRQLDAIVAEAENYARTEVAVDPLGFLDWLDVADEQEGGLQQADVEPAEGAVQLITIHSAKGLEWDVVAVAGLREKRFPSGEADRWLGKNGKLPAPLRGDSASIPQWDSDQPTLQFWTCAAGEASSAKFADLDYKEAARIFTEEEERRLAYVAVTRAKKLLICTGASFYGSSQGQDPSTFLTEIKTDVDSFSQPGIEAPWVELDEDTKKTGNPKQAETLGAVFPYDPLKPLPVTRYRTEQPDTGQAALPTRVPLAQPQEHPGRREALTRAAALVRAEEAAHPADHHHAAPAADGPASETPVSDWEQEAHWIVDRHRKLHTGDTTDLARTHLSVSAVVGLARRDSEYLAAQQRRPVPHQPRAAARRGTIMHEWIEDFFAAGLRLPDIEEPSRGDEDLDGAFHLDEVKDAFATTPWAHRELYAAEIPIVTTLAGTVVRGRIDAVFVKNTAGEDLTGADFDRWELLPAGERSARMAECSWELVDWKTGQIPAGEDLRNKQIQLAIYRIAFHRLYGVPLENIRTAFVYLEHGATIDGEDLPDAQALNRIIDDAQIQQQPQAP